MSVEVTTRNLSGSEPTGIPPVLLQLEHQSMTLRELIAVSVTEQVNELAARLAAERSTAAAAEITQHYLLAGSVPDDVPDTATAVARTLDAFQHNRFLVMIGGRQVDDLDQVVDLHTGTEVIFLRVTPLKGG